MKHVKLMIVTTLALVTLGLIALDRTHMTVDDAPVIPAASLAPDVTFALLGGGNVRLHSLAGHKIWLHFWASWCAPCRKEFPALLTRLQQSDAVLLAVSGDENAQDAQRFLTPYRRDFKALFDSGKIIVAHDPDHHVIEGTFQTFQYPETIFIGKDLAMQRKIAGVWEGE